MEQSLACRLAVREERGGHSIDSPRPSSCFMVARQLSSEEVMVEEALKEEGAPRPPDCWAISCTCNISGQRGITNTFTFREHI